MHVDIEKLIHKCNACPRHAPNTIRSKNNMIRVLAVWPFQNWAIDITGPFPEASGWAKFMIVSINYFTKWIKAKPVSIINAASVKKFIWEFIICRFGLPVNIVNNNGKQFTDQRV
ncbi:uncharacterized protein LOC143594723 [Bidens hawaiensis]|uniref:uncharacterized protein LOC143594723 n=1 Tax=Bidens hawaiensis TaxID=980011 RepID=UPI0040494EC9